VTPKLELANTARPSFLQEVTDQARPEEVVVEIPTQPLRLLTTEQAAELLAVSVRTVKNLMIDGKLAYVKIGRATRVDPVDVDKYVTRNRRKQRQPRRGVN
jgi:excisionase family DNA binding protein